MDRVGVEPTTSACIPMCSLKEMNLAALQVTVNPWRCKVKEFVVRSRIVIENSTTNSVHVLEY